MMGGNMGDQEIDAQIVQLHDLSSANPDRQYQAAIDLGNIKDWDAPTKTRVVDELIKALSPSHQALTRAHAAEALGKLLDSRSVGPLIQSLQDDYRLVRSYAARSLRQLGDPAAIDPLVDRLGHDDFFGVKAESAEALGVLCRGNSSASADDARKVLQEFRKAEQEKATTEAERNKQELAENRRLLAAIDNSLKDLNLIIEEAVDTVGDLKYAFLTRNLELVQQKVEALEEQLQQARSAAQDRPDNYIRSLSSSWSGG
jgi:hypothetical protein